MINGTTTNGLAIDLGSANLKKDKSAAALAAQNKKGSFNFFHRVINMIRKSHPHSNTAVCANQGTRNFCLKFLKRCLTIKRPTEDIQCLEC